MKKNILILLLFFFANSISNLFAQASLSSSDIENVKVSFQGIEQTITVIRDARNFNQWYYIPNEVRLVEKPYGTQKIPEFTLLKYQFISPLDPSKYLEGGFLQFAATLELPVELFEQVKSHLQLKYNPSINLGPINFKSATVNAYTPVPASVGENCPILGSAVVGNGVAPLFSSQKMPFSFPFNKVGVNIIDPLINSPTGIPVFFTFTYSGLTPPEGFTVRVHYNRIAEHYSRDERFMAQASYLGFFGASYESSSQEIFNSLISNNDIEISGIIGGTISQQQLDNYLQPILARINSTLITLNQPPPNITPAVASNPKSSGSYFSAGYSVSSKKVTELTKLEETYNFHLQQVVERTSVVGGFIGIGQYSEDIKNQIIIDATKDEYKTPRFVLPIPISNNVASEFGINRETVITRILNNGEEIASGSASFIPNSSTEWFDNHNNVGTRSLSFSGLGLDPKKVSITELFKLEFSSNYSLEYNSTYPAYSNDGSINGNWFQRFDVLEVDPSNLGFYQIDNRENLIEIKIKIYFDDMKIMERSIKPSFENGVVINYSSLKYILPKFEKISNLKCNIKFIYKDGKTKKWIHNDQNIKSLPEFKEGTIELSPEQIVN